MSETKEITGVCEEISERNGWTAFSINVGSQYPVKLATKVEKIIEDARAAGSKQATWRFKEQESEKINEHSGKPYVNRYLESVEVSDGPVTASGKERPQEAAHAPVAIGDKERVISRLACLKAAAQVFSGAMNAGEPGEEVRPRILETAASFERWVYRDLGTDDVPF